MARASPNEQRWGPEDPGQQPGPSRVMTGKGDLEAAPFVPGSGMGIPAVLSLAGSQDRPRGRSPGRVVEWSWAGTLMTPATLGSGQAAPFPRGERAVPSTLLRQVGPRPARPTHRELRSRSDKPWPRRSLSRRARCAASWVRILMGQLLCSLSTDRSYREARHVPGPYDRSRHVGSVIVSHLPLALRRRRLVPPLSQLAPANPSPKRIRQRSTSGRGGKRSNSRCSRIG